jgi:hypothetical protein
VALAKGAAGDKLEGSMAQHHMQCFSTQHCHASHELLASNRNHAKPAAANSLQQSQRTQQGTNKSARAGSSSSSNTSSNASRGTAAIPKRCQNPHVDRFIKRDKTARRQHTAKQQLPGSRLRRSSSDDDNDNNSNRSARASNSANARPAQLQCPRACSNPTVPRNLASPKKQQQQQQQQQAKGQQPPADLRSFINSCKMRQKAASAAHATNSNRPSNAARSTACTAAATAPAGPFVSWPLPSVLQEEHEAAALFSSGQQRAVIIGSPPPLHFGICDPAHLPLKPQAGSTHCCTLQPQRRA